MESNGDAIPREKPPSAPAATQNPTQSPHGPGKTDPDLAAIVTAWPTLTADQRRRIVAITGGGKP
ncbi:MAG: hypothetical protein K8S99_11450 [Planctomycetes bacterium]|nr:hypothetical protein [Planctomycetota bacterium]